MSGRANSEALTRIENRDKYATIQKGEGLCGEVLKLEGHEFKSW